MVAVVPATLANEIDEQLSLLTQQATHWYGPSDDAVLAIEDQISQLEKAAAAIAHAWRGNLYHLMGDIETANYWFDNALKIGAPVLMVQSIRVHSHANLGYFSEARAIYEHIADLDHPRLTRLWTAGLATISFRHMVDLYPKAEQAGLELDPAAFHLACRANDVLDRLGASESDVLPMVDAYGDVLRSRRLFWLNRYPDLVCSMDRDEPGLLIDFKVFTSVHEALDMTDEGIDRCLDADLFVPGLSAAFSASPKTWE